MRPLAILLILSLASTACSAAGVVVLANTIDSGMASDLYAFLQNGGLEPIKADAKAFEVVKDSPYIVVLGGQNSPEGVGGVVAGMLSQAERESLLTPGSSGVFIKEDVFIPGQIVYVMAGYGAQDTVKAWVQNEEAVSSAIAERQPKNITLSAPDTITVPHISNLLAYSFPVNVSNYGIADADIEVSAYLNGGIRLDTDPQTLNLSRGQTRNVLVALNPKTIVSGDTVLVKAAGASIKVSLNQTEYKKATACYACLAD
jgi:hypothetical protein